VPLFSIIIPVFNAESVVLEAIRSIQEQTCGDWEILVQDGGSTDRTVAAIEALGDDRVRIVSEKDGGIYDAMNRAVKRAAGQWVYFLGADDRLYDNNVLADVAGALTARTEVRVLYGDVESTRWTKRYDGEFDALKIGEHNICHQAIFYHKSVLEKHGPYCTSYKSLADWDLNLKWFFDPECPAEWLDRVIAHYADGGSSSGGETDKFLTIKDLVYVRLAGTRVPVADRKRILKAYARRQVNAREFGRFFQAALMWLGQR